MNLALLMSEDRRLLILRLLAQDPGYQLNVYVLRPALQAMGHTVSHDLVETDLAWLAEQGLVTVGRASDVTVGKLTARGADVAQGLATVPGVKRPEPGE
ncbi:MAG: ArsR family transcriptional regulator [Humidesulfovibrio sp.]